MSQNLPNRSLRNFLSSSRHHYLPIPRGPCSSKSRFFSTILTVYYNCKYFPWYTRELLECHLGIEPAGAIIPPPLPVSSERVCKSASLQVCKSASLQVCRSASLQVCGLQVCSLRLSHTVSAIGKGVTTTWKCLISRFVKDVNKQCQNFLSLYELGYGW